MLVIVGKYHARVKRVTVYVAIILRSKVCARWFHFCFNPPLFHFHFVLWHTRKPGRLPRFYLFC